MRKLIRKYLLSSCLLLSACSHLPPAVENPPPSNISYSQAMQQMDIYQKSTVRWGGIIISVENLQYQSFIQVLLYPLDNHGRPDLNQTSVGRFLIKSPRFLDPIIYKINAEVTTSGILEGLVERPVDKILLILPVVLSEIIYLWPEYSADSSYPRYNNYGSYGYGSYWNYTYSNGGYRTLNPPRFPHHPPPHCGTNQIPNGLGGCKPKRIRCEGNEAPDGLGGCKPKRIRCEGDEEPDGLGGCNTIIPKPIRCEADEIPDGSGGCKPKRIRCEGDEAPDGVGGCVKTAPIQIIDQKPDTSGEQERVRKEEERQRESAVQQQQQEAQERQRQERESTAQQQQQEAQERQRQERESAAQQQQQEAQERQRQERESAAQQQQEETQERQRQAVAPAQKAHGHRNREE